MRTDKKPLEKIKVQKPNPQKNKNKKPAWNTRLAARTAVALCSAALLPFLSLLALTSTRIDRYRRQESEICHIQTMLFIYIKEKHVSSMQAHYTSRIARFYTMV